jgi:glycosyltransferase involved in cell wall biosynthesis
MLPLVRVLFVTYVFPPVGGAGVQRVVKMVRHLPAHGITPLVLTAANPSVPLRDDSLVADVGPSVRVVRTRTLEPGYGAKRAAASIRIGSRTAGIGSRLVRAATRAGHGALFPDPQVLWLPTAAMAIHSLARERPGLDAVVISAPPFSQMLLAPFAQRVANVPVVIDYRDEWTTTLRAGHDAPASAFASDVAARLERAIVARADAVTTATEEYRQALLDRFAAVDPERVHYLPNGFDPDDLPKRVAPAPRDRFLVSYAGTVFRLTSFRSVLAALRLLYAEYPELAAHLEVAVYGRIAPSEMPAFEDAERLGVRLHGYTEHARVLGELARSHLNLCVLDDVEGAERIYPAKIFELMALRRRVLVVAPPGALSRLATRHRVGDVVAPTDPRAIARVLLGHLEAFHVGAYEPRTSPVDVDRFDRRALAGELASILRRLRFASGAPDRDDAAETERRERRLAG